MEETLVDGGLERPENPQGGNKIQEVAVAYRTSVGFLKWRRFLP
jgi:hypothetical protein